jgi:Family of unknown function (DUF6093)
VKLNLTSIEPIVEDLMVDTCTVTSDALGSLNTGTGQHTITATEIYNGKCLVGPPGTATDSDNFYTLLLPKAAVDVERGYTVTITASETADLVGKKFDIVNPLLGTYAVCQVIGMAARMEPGT